MANRAGKHNTRRFSSTEIGSSMNSDSTATSSSLESSPAPMNAYQGRKTAHAEDIACRLLAYQNRCGSARKSLDVKTGNAVPQLPIQPTQTEDVTEILIRKFPPPPRRRKQTIDSESDEPPLRMRSCSIDGPEKDDFHRSTVSDFGSSSASMHKNSSTKLDFHSSLPTLSTLSPSIDCDGISRNVRVTQFNDEPRERIENADLLPSHCDKKGRCIYHSNMKLYKKHMLGGFTLQMDKCPLCHVNDLEQSLSLNSKQTIVLKRSSSTGRAASNGRGRSRKAVSENDFEQRVPGGSAFLEETNSKIVGRRASDDITRSTSLERSSAAFIGSPAVQTKSKTGRTTSNGRGRSRKAVSENEFEPRVQGGSTVLEETRPISVGRRAAEENTGSPSLERASLASTFSQPPPPYRKLKLSKKSTSGTNIDPGIQETSNGRSRSRKAASENEFEPRVQVGSAFLQETRPISVGRRASEDITGSPSLERSSLASTCSQPPPPHRKLKLSKKSTSDTDIDPGIQESSAIHGPNKSSSLEKRAFSKHSRSSSFGLSPLPFGSNSDSQSKPRIVGKAASEADRDVKVRAGSVFLGENCSNSVERKVPRSASLETKPQQLSGPQLTQPNAKLSSQVMPETDKDARFQGGLSTEEEHTKNVGLGPSIEQTMSMSERSNASSSHNSPTQTRPRLSHRLSDMSAEDNPRNSSHNPSHENNQSSSSMLERGLEKLHLLNPIGRSNSRQRSSRSKSERSESSRKSKSSERSKKRAFDNTGRCKKHPSIILARKRPFSNGWEIIRDCCPLCYEADQEFSTSKMNHLLGRDKSPVPNAYNSSLHSSELLPSESNTSTVGEMNRGRSGSRGARDSANRSRSRNSVEPSPRMGMMSSQPPRVQKMPWTTPWGESGWYTGEVNENGIPNGQGRMRMKTGNVVDGVWNNGYSEEYLEKHQRMKSGFGTNVAPWKKSAASPHCETFSRPSMVTSATIGMAAQNIVQSSPQYTEGMQCHSHLYNQNHPSSMQRQQPWNHQQTYADPSHVYGQMPPGHYR